MVEDEFRRTRKNYFEDEYNMDTQEQSGLNVGVFSGVQKANVLEGSQLGRLNWR